MGITDFIEALLRLSAPVDITPLAIPLNVEDDDDKRVFRVAEILDNRPVVRCGGEKENVSALVYEEEQVVLADFLVRHLAGRLLDDVLSVSVRRGELIRFLQLVSGGCRPDGEEE